MFDSWCSLTGLVNVMSYSSWSSDFCCLVPSFARRFTVQPEVLYMGTSSAGDGRSAWNTRITLLTWPCSIILINATSMTRHVAILCLRACCHSSMPPLQDESSVSAHIFLGLQLTRSSPPLLCGSGHSPLGHEGGSPVYIAAILYILQRSGTAVRLYSLISSM
jgi:hypothetical protein